MAAAGQAGRSGVECPPHALRFPTFPHPRHWSLPHARRLSGAGRARALVRPRPPAPAVAPPRCPRARVRARRTPGRGPHFAAGPLECRPGARCPHVARGHDAGLRRLRRGRCLALEGRLRSGARRRWCCSSERYGRAMRREAGAGPARPCHHAAHAGDPRGAGTLPDAALRASSSGISSSRRRCLSPTPRCRPP